MVISYNIEQIALLILLVVTVAAVVYSYVFIYSSDQNFVLYEGNNTGIKNCSLLRHLLGTPNESKWLSSLPGGPFAFRPWWLVFHDIRHCLVPFACLISAFLMEHQYVVGGRYAHTRIIPYTELMTQKNRCSNTDAHLSRSDGMRLTSFQFYTKKDIACPLHAYCLKV